MTRSKHSDTILIFDVDGTICDSKPYDYENPPVVENARKYINKFYDAGWYIIMRTARYYFRSGGSSFIAGKMGFEELRNWLVKHEFKYHEIQFGKPSAFIYADNHGWRIDNSKGEIDWKKLDKFLDNSGNIKSTKDTVDAS